MEILVGKCYFSWKFMLVFLESYSEFAPGCRPILTAEYKRTSPVELSLLLIEIWMNAWDTNNTQIRTVVFNSMTEKRFLETKHFILFKTSSSSDTQETELI